MKSLTDAREDAAALQGDYLCTEPGAAIPAKFVVRTMSGSEPTEMAMLTRLGWTRVAAGVYEIEVDTAT